MCNRKDKEEMGFVRVELGMSRERDGDGEEGCRGRWDKR